MVCPQVYKMESELRHKLFPPNAWIKVLHFNVFTSCPKDELHQSFIGLYGEHRSFQPSSTATQRFSQLYDKSCTSPFLSLPSMLAELRTSLGGCHSLEVSPCFLDGNITSTIPL